MAGVPSICESLDAPLHDYTRTRLESVPSDEPALDARLLADEDAPALWAAVDALPEHLARVVRQRYLEGLSYRAIERVTGCSAETARQHEKIALRKLRGSLPAPTV